MGLNRHVNYHHEKSGRAEKILGSRTHKYASDWIEVEFHGYATPVSHAVSTVCNKSTGRLLLNVVCELPLSILIIAAVAHYDEVSDMTLVSAPSSAPSKLNYQVHPRPRDHPADAAFILILPHPFQISVIFSSGTP